MSAGNIEQALEGVYGALAENNKDIDTHIAALKKAMVADGKKEVEIDPDKLFQNNREGRKMMQSYFKRKGVKITFKG